MASRGRLRFDMRVAAYGAALLCLLVVLGLAVVGIDDVRTASALRGRGQVAQGRLVDRICTDSRKSNGFSERSCVGIWAYRAATGEQLTLHDRGAAPSGVVETGQGWGPPREGQVVYLPDRPTTARLRTEIAPELVPLIGTGGVFMLIGLAIGATAHWLLDPARVMAPNKVPSRDAARRRERRDLWIGRAMLIGIPLAVIAGLMLL